MVSDFFKYVEISKLNRGGRSQHRDLLAVILAVCICMLLIVCRLIVIQFIGLIAMDEGK